MLRLKPKNNYQALFSLYRCEIRDTFKRIQVSFTDNELLQKYDGNPIHGLLIKVDNELEIYKDKLLGDLSKYECTKQELTRIKHIMSTVHRLESDLLEISKPTSSLDVRRKIINDFFAYSRNAFFSQWAKALLGAVPTAIAVFAGGVGLAYLAKTFLIGLLIAGSVATVAALTVGMLIYNYAKNDLEERSKNLHNALWLLVEDRSFELFAQQRERVCLNHYAELETQNVANHTLQKDLSSTQTKSPEKIDYKPEKPVVDLMHTSTSSTTRPTAPSNDSRSAAPPASGTHEFVQRELLSGNAAAAPTHDSSSDARGDRFNFGDRRLDDDADHAPGDEGIQHGSQFIFGDTPPRRNPMQ